MTLLSLVNAAKAASAAAKVSKGAKVATNIAKGLWTTVEIADAGLDMYTLGNQIAKELGVTDVKIRQLINQVTEKGVEYDTIMNEVTQANIDITNLLGAITSLHGINNDFTERQGLALDQSAALDTLKDRLNRSIPTTYSWFENLGQLDGSLSAENQQTVDAIQELLGPNYLTMGIAGASVGVRAAMLGYSWYKKRNLGQHAPEIPELYRQKATVFDGADLEMLREGTEARKTRFQAVSSGFAKYGTMMFQGVEKLLTVGSFGLNIYMLIQEQKAEDEMEQSLNEMLQGYESEIDTYNFVLNGCENEDRSVNEDGLQAVAKEFGIILDEQTDEAKKTLVKGYTGILEDYDETLDNLVDSIDASYASMIEQFTNAKVYSEESQLVSDLETSYISFKKLKDAGQNENLASDRRKEVLDKIQDEFSNSLAKQMKEINQELTLGIANHKSLSILEPYAQSIINDANQFDMAFPLSDTYIARKAGVTKQILDISYPEREVFTTESQILEALKELITELREKSTEVASV